MSYIKLFLVFYELILAIGLLTVSKALKWLPMLVYLKATVIEQLYVYVYIQKCVKLLVSLNVKGLVKVLVTLYMVFDWSANFRHRFLVT